MGYTVNLEAKTLANEYFREVLFTAKHCQLVVMSIAVGEDIGEEIHQLDQFIRVEAGEGKAVLDGEETAISDGWAVVVPAGAKHNIINTGATPLKLYTIYTPPEHKDGTIHITKAEALADEHDHFEA
ncbi:cupin domain-containing protein [Candidatus Falkowbacteria bacterium CG10_big_fil_rev_8_21_14_0_10_37_14]|uniref:Cupin domain-containing protein n=1 Tax=Candidatus Falkowbacteria bacterium CG10_big_fil_rev_8_21_14_0_10_37_14 TaxID=1974561 RepID=A0A2M6WT48_9BACT|nr:cupin domain-containing protein [Candidatus Falkowbacteria bacterium]PIT95977.1 MAG: cupin domain-containing protein [Candidatus Falkowbacteria bacterium CG10_big_fil_rev_8_21_14_0_10_37_14]